MDPGPMTQPIPNRIQDIIPPDRISPLSDSRSKHDIVKTSSLQTIAVVKQKNYFVVYRDIKAVVYDGVEHLISV